MDVTLELYGGLQRLAGAAEVTVRLEPGARTVADAIEALARSTPSMAEPLRHAAVAVGAVLARRGDALQAGARLALLPPVAGG